jgi:hypothetical protein
MGRLTPPLGRIPLKLCKGGRPGKQATGAERPQKSLEPLEPIA